MKKAFLEPVVHVLRLIEGEDPQFGDPFYGSATITVDDQKVACIRGLTIDSFDKDAWKAINDALRAKGVESVIYTRRTRGKVRVVRVKVV